MSPSTQLFHPLALRVPPLAVSALAAALGWLPARVLPTLTLEYSARPLVTAAFVAAGLVCSLGGVISFRRARTTVNPLTPDAATALVMSGIYRITRNPMYLGFLFFLLAELAWLANPAGCVVVPLFVVYLNRFQIDAEERALRRRFGQSYNSYAAHVRRWI